jgi:ribosome-associated protein
MPLSEDTREALLAAKRMTRAALQRQYRYLCSRLAEEDVPALRSALAGALQPHAAEVAALQEAERWRDRLLSPDDGQIAALVERYPDCDESHLRELVQRAKQERDVDKPPRSARQLFRYLRRLSGQPE